jgi:hypothetical protein
MKKILYLSLLICLASQLVAQKFTRLGTGLNSYAQSIFADTAENKIYITGNFFEPSAPQNNFCYGGVATWEVNKEFQKEWIYATESCAPTASVSPFVRFKNKLYLFGNCLKENDSIAYYYDLCVLENGIWKPAGNIFTGAFVSCAIVVGDSVMYIGGEFDTFGGVATTNLVKYDGKNFYAFPPIANNYNTAVDALAWYKGELYAVGNFGDISGGDAAKWNGSKWELMGGGIKGAIEHVNDLIIYEDMLIVAGSFWRANGNPGNCVAAWDGNNWHTMGENSFLDLGQIWDLEIYKDELYAGGAFDNTYPLSSSFSKWNGTEWERQAIFNIFQDKEDWGAVASMTVLNDELYITGSFRKVNGVLANNVVKYNDTAKADTAIIPIPPLPNDFELYPNPCIDGTLILKNTLLENAEIFLYNDLGQPISVKAMLQNGKNVEIMLLESQANGMYYLHLNEGGRRVRVKWLLLR